MAQSQQLTIEQALSRAKKATKKGKTAVAVELYTAILQHQPNHPSGNKLPPTNAASSTAQHPGAAAQQASSSSSGGVPGGNGGSGAQNRPNGTFWYVPNAAAQASQMTRKLEPIIWAGDTTVGGKGSSEGAQAEKPCAQTMQKRKVFFVFLVTSYSEMFVLLNKK